MLISGRFEYSYNISNIRSFSGKLKLPLSITRVCTADPGENVTETKLLRLSGHYCDWLVVVPALLISHASVGKITGTVFNQPQAHLKVKLGHNPGSSADDLGDTLLHTPTFHLANLI